MLDVNIKFDLEEYLCAVVDTLREKLPEMKIVKAYPTDDIEIKDIPVPAVLIDFGEIIPTEKERDPGDGRKGIDFSMEAYVIISSVEEYANLRIRQHAINVASVIHDSRKFVQAVSPGEITEITPRIEVNDDNQSYLAWGITWIHMTYLAKQQLDELCDDPPADASDISTVFLGYDPDVGLDHKDDYVQVLPR